MSGVGRFWSMPRSELEEKLRMKRRRKNLSEGNDLSTLGVEQPIHQSQLESLQSLSPIATNAGTDHSEEMAQMAPTTDTMDEGAMSEQSSSMQDQRTDAQTGPTIEIRKSKSLGNMGPRRSSDSCKASKARKALRTDHVTLVTSSADSACEGVSEGERERRDGECLGISGDNDIDNTRSECLLLEISQDIDTEDCGCERPEIEVEVVDKLMNHVQLARQASATADQNF